MADHKRIRRIQPVLLADKIGEEDAAEVARALGRDVGEIYFAEPSITELQNIVIEQAKAQARAEAGEAPDEEQQFGSIQRVLSSVLKGADRKSVFRAEALKNEPASTFADLIHIATMFVAERVQEVFSLGGEEEDPKAQPPSGERENSTK